MCCSHTVFRSGIKERSEPVFQLTWVECSKCSEKGKHMMCLFTCLNTMDHIHLVISETFSGLFVWCLKSFDVRFVGLSKLSASGQLFVGVHMAVSLSWTTHVNSNYMRHFFYNIHIAYIRGFFFYNTHIAYTNTNETKLVWIQMELSFFFSFFLFFSFSFTWGIYVLCLCPCLDAVLLPQSC